MFAFQAVFKMVLKIKVQSNNVLFRDTGEFH